MDMMMNMEIVPNWHPIFVHFTIGLLGVSALLYLAGLVFKNEHLLIAGRWNLWIGAFLTIGTVAAGLNAYYTVAHDGASHIAMTNHRNWALATASVFALLALWSLWKHRGAKAVSPVFVGLLLLATVLLGITGFKGGEVVYRHGTGVMRMPIIQGDGGHASHHHGAEELNAAEPEPDHHDAEMMQAPAEDHGEMPALEESEHDHSAHQH